MGTSCDIKTISKNKELSKANTLQKSQKEDSLKFIWIDYNIDSKENIYYKNELKQNFTLIECKSIEQGLNQINEIKFERVILMLSQKMFNDFLPEFEKEKTKICCSLNIIVFSRRDKKRLVEEICNNNKDISSGYIFDKENIFNKFSQIKDFIQGEVKGKNVITPNFEKIDETNKIYYDYEQIISKFDKIENFEELILPIYFHKIMDPISLEEIHNFNYYLTSFKEAKKIISQLENIADMPIEIVCKYWAYIYTLEKGKFFSVLNNGLRKKKFKLFLPFIKMMYEGIKRNVFTSIKDEVLYSGGIISNKELQELRNSINEKNNISSININNNGFPILIYYFKSFKSFTRKKDITKTFMKMLPKDSTKVLYIVEKNNIEGDLVSNSYIKDFSKYGYEEEVLFFPFSSFEIEKIEDEINHVNIYLKYLGRYKSIIEGKKSMNNLFKDIPINNFGREINEMGLINYKFIRFFEVEEVISLDGNSKCVLCFETNVLIISISNMVKLYKREQNKNICNILIHEKEITDLLKLNENTFISCSKDKRIKFIQVTNDFTKLILLKSFVIHTDEVNLVIKLKKKFIRLLLK